MSPYRGALQGAVQAVDQLALEAFRRQAARLEGLRDVRLGSVHLGVMVSLHGRDGKPGLPASLTAAWLSARRASASC